MRGQQEVPQNTLEQVRAFIGAVKWQWAKTYADTFPHYYTVRKWLAEVDGFGDEEFELFVRTIRTYGFEAYFGRSKYTYLVVDGWKYWTMWASVERTGVINREEWPEGKEIP